METRHNEDEKTRETHIFESWCSSMLLQSTFYQLIHVVRACIHTLYVGKDLTIKSAVHGYSRILTAYICTNVRSRVKIKENLIKGRAFLVINQTIYKCIYIYG